MSTLERPLLAYVLPALALCACTSARLSLGAVDTDEAEDLTADTDDLDESGPRVLTGAAIPPWAACPVGERDGGDGACVPEGTCSPGFERVGEFCGGWIELVPLLEATGIDGTATVLNDGRILVGTGSRPQIYDPRIGRVEEIEGLNVGRSSLHTATRLLDGRVLYIGGSSTFPIAEVFDPTSETFSFVRRPDAPMYEHTASLLLDGRVLVAGGYDARHEFSERAQIYDPVSDEWTDVGSLHRPRASHDAVSLPDGNVFVIGNYTGPEIFSAQTETWDPIETDWGGKVAVLLADGRIFALSGVTTIDRGFVYDPVTGSVTNVEVEVEDWIGVRTSTTVNLLPTGHVLVAGGWEFTHVVRDDGMLPTVDQLKTLFEGSHLYDPVHDTWSKGGRMNHPRSSHLAVAYAHQGVAALVFGGESEKDGEQTTSVEGYVLR